jgi:MerR family transcriptional regulator, redox-sensitive transcriptional activator SoxR
MKIGELAARSGLNASAIRYYEKLGLLAPPGRLNGQRRYPTAVIDRVLLIRFATEMGFTLTEIRLLLAGLRDNTSPSPRWKKFAGRKIAEMQQTIDRATRLQKVLSELLRCRCTSLHECVSCLNLSQDLNPSSRQRHAMHRL